MKWTSIKLHLLTLIMQEIEVCEKNYCDLINKIKAKKTKALIDEFLEMRLDISKRIEELEDYFDENFSNIRMNILEKGIFQLKRLLFYNPDKSNDQEEADLPEFTGLVMDFRLIEKTIRNQEFAKNLKQKNLKGPQDNKMRNTMRGNAAMRASKFPQNIRKTMNANMLKKGVKEKEEMENENGAEEDDFENKDIKKKLRIRLTDEEYRLLLKLKAKKKSAQQQQ